MTEVSALPDASIPLAGDELVAILQAATGKKLTLALLADYISEQGGGGLPGVYLLSQFGGVPDLDPATGTGTNSITALRDCFQAMHEAGGGMLFIDGMYRLEGDLLLPYDTDGVGPIQDARDFTIFGLAPRLCGSAQRPPEGGSVLCWTDGGDQAARIVGLGSGGLLMRDFTLWSKEGTTAGNGRPFIHTGATSAGPSAMTTSGRPAAGTRRSR